MEMVNLPIPFFGRTKKKNNPGHAVRATNSNHFITIRHATRRMISFRHSPMDFMKCIPEHHTARR
jgi:hypothetical protein